MNKAINNKKKPWEEQYHSCKGTGQGHKNSFSTRLHNLKTAQTGLSLPWLQTPKTGFLVMRFK